MPRHQDPLNPQITIPRTELLIAPRDVAPPQVIDTLLRYCESPAGDARNVQQFQSGGFQLTVAADSPSGHSRSADPNAPVCITEGPWPEAVGMAARVCPGPGEESWTIESDRYGLRPIYYGFDRQKRPIVCTRPDVVAALTGSQLSCHSLAEQLLIGFNLDDRSPFEDVRRLCPGERLVYGQEHGLIIEQEDLANRRSEGAANHAEHWLDAVQPMVIKAFERGDALELSGGVDSRFVLAIGIQRGVKPRLAFTLGDDADDDVRLARLICRRFDIEHVVFPAHIRENHAAGDGAAFVSRAGFAVNACSYAWLPGVFSRLAPLRSAQIGGGGGECAYGFYYSPFDACCATPSIRRLWVEKRLFQTGVAMADLFGEEAARELAGEVADAAMRILQRAEGPWRTRTDEFYLTQRVPNSGGAVLSASACWYRPLQPLLHQPYIEWGRSLSSRQRAGRRIQMKIIYKLNRELGEIPYSGGRTHASNAASTLRRFAHQTRSTTGKIVRRLRNRRATADLGATSTAEALVGNENVRRSLRRLAARPELNLDSEQVESMLELAADHEHELGALITAAWADDSVIELSERLSGAETDHEMLRAA